VSIEAPDMIAALLLLAVALSAGRGSAYLRFAAMLFAALALGCCAQIQVPGLGRAVALIILPLGGATLGLFALARFGRKLPALPATLLLAASLACGLGALLLDDAAILALVPLALGGLAVIFASLHRMALIAAFSGMLLFAGACAFTIAGTSAATLSLLAAALFGLSVQTFSSNRPADFSVSMP
jgi:hypothetical protein